MQYAGIAGDPEEDEPIGWVCAPDVYDILKYNRNRGVQEGSRLESKAKALLAAEAAYEKKAFDIVLFNMDKLTIICDYFLICSGSNRTQIQAIADAVLESLEQSSGKKLQTEGYDEARWVLIDAGDVVAHIFHEETRSFYDLDRLWSDAEKTEYKPEQAELV